jgi:hypothetical protein
VDAPIAPYINPTNFIEEFDDRKKIKSHNLLKTYADKLKPFNVSARLKLKYKKVTYSCIS